MVSGVLSRRERRRIRETALGIPNGRLAMMMKSNAARKAAATTAPVARARRSSIRPAAGSKPQASVSASPESRLPLRPAAKKAAVTKTGASSSRKLSAQKLRAQKVPTKTVAISLTALSRATGTSSPSRISSLPKPQPKLKAKVQEITRRKASAYAGSAAVEVLENDVDLDDYERAEFEIEDEQDQADVVVARTNFTQLKQPAMAPVFEVSEGLDPEAARLARRDSVVIEHLPLVKAIAVRVHENLPVHVDLDDLVHAGVLGLFDAASKFNPDKQVAFSSYAKHRIKGAILDSLRQLDWASRDMRRRHKQLEAVTRDLAATLQRNPTEAELAAKMGMDADRWRTMMLDLRNVGLISASTRPSENDDLPAPDFPTGPENHPDSICSREQLRATLAVAIKALPERYQKVVSLYYTGELTMKEIGGMLGINESRVSQIHKSALEKMQVVLEANGISSPQAF